MTSKAICFINRFISCLSMNSKNVLFVLTIDEMASHLKI